uniref:NADH-ubiquinone oxidoreductase chain 2 n=1 Tax=Indosialis bannaensis TaxID=2597563 RepID=A0A8K1ZAQ1_9NEOP|nr:NADH dehydrogenase subunit 2 [Indosialis bannaensis]
MFNNISKFIFLIFLFSGTFLSISANSWFGAWIGLEINLMSFIPLINNSSNIFSTESSLKYFLTQALASMMILFSVIMSMFFLGMTNFLVDNNFMQMIINSSLLLKMGAAPFHYWFPGVMEGSSWLNCMILMTWQKIAPLILISYCINYYFIMVTVMFCVIIGSFGGINQTSLRKLMTYSSINHLGWMLASLLISSNLFMMYFIFYCFLSISMVIFFMNYKIFHLSQTFTMLNLDPVIKFLIFCNLLSLGGLPPFLGFLPKWLVIQMLVENNMYMLIFLMVSMTLITLYFYIRITYSAFMLMFTELKWINNFFNSYHYILLFMSFFSIFGLILISLIYTIL